MCVGSISDDLRPLASKICRELALGTRTVWADDEGKVFTADPSDADADHVPLHWMAGTFGLGQPVQDIEEDLRVLLQERTRNWIITRT